MTQSHLSQPQEPTNTKRPRSIFTAILSGILVFVLLGGLFEGVVRLGWMDRALPMRSVGNYHTEFETKWFKLQDYVEENGGVDVILLGNSMVNTGIDPSVLVTRYKSLTGEDLRVFNFGIEGLTVAPLSSLAQVLVDTYHPKTIILFTEMRDYIAGNGDETAEEFLSNAWIQQQLGNPSLEGYMETHSTGLQRLLPFRYWANADFLDTYILDARRLSETTSQGYEAARESKVDITLEPDPDNPKEELNFALFKDFSMDPGRVADLEKILSFNEQCTEIIVTQMPVYPTYYAYLENDSDKTAYETELVRIVSRNGGYYLAPVDYLDIRDSGYNDNHHLNYIGAPIYSELLAEQLASLCTERGMCLGAGDEGSQP